MIQYLRGVFMHKVGNSIDIHRLVKGSGIVLGGVHIPCEYKSEAHSDGDVVLHALTEAIFGALGSSDLGEHFPDNDPIYQGMDSSYFVNEALKLLKHSGYHLVNIDCSISLENPKLGKYKELIKENIAKLTSLTKKDIAIKAGTFEKVGPIGHNEAVLAWVVVLIENS
jgi:2-C-methyl-D-erythritol 2,4-cyclodiphosphate synthase